MNLKKSFNKLTNLILSIIFPIECLRCKAEGQYICQKCFTELPIKIKVEIFDNDVKYLDNVHWAIDYNLPIMQQLIHFYKFRFIQELHKPLAKIMIKYFENIKIEINNPLVIPVPLHKKRLLERGFNQSELLAREFASYFKFDFGTDVIVRSKNTAHQVGLNKKDRQKNIQKAFEVLNPIRVKNRQVVIIDDVVTTGSTMDEMAGELKLAGAVKVYGLAIAKDK